MNPLALLALAMMLVSASPLSAQGPSFLLEDEPPGMFRDLTIRQLVDATDILTRPGMPAVQPPEAAADATLCHPDTLLFCEINTLVPSEPRRTIRSAPFIDGEAAVPLPAVAPASPPFAPAPPGPCFVVNCSNSGTGGVEPASQGSRNGAPPSEADRVPEPSAVLLLVGAAAWILLRRKL